MKKSFILLSIVFVFVIKINAQKWEISPKISPNLIFISSNSEDFTKGKTGFGASCSVLLEYLINDKISVGLEPAYSYLYRKFETPWYMMHPHIQSNYIKTIK